MILTLAVLIGVANFSLAFRPRYCNSASRLALEFRLNEREVPKSLSQTMKLWDIDLNDILNKEDFILLLEDMCGSRNLTFEWLFQQIETVCPQSYNMVRSLLEPTGAVCNQDGTVSDLTREALSEFVRVNKSVDCTFSYTDILDDCVTNAFMEEQIPRFPERTLETDIIENSIISTAAIRCAVTRVKRLAPGCGSVQDLRTYSLVSELITRQPFKLRGSFNWNNVMPLI